MTTLVANPSGRKSAKDKKPNPNKTTTATPAAAVAAATAVAVTPNNVVDNSNNQTEDLRKGDKFQPTAEQMRIASLMSDKKDENDLKPKIEQIVELTGATREDAAVALYDCDNDMTKAIEMILDGDSLDSEWQSTGRKKKTKAQIASSQSVVESLTNGSKKGLDKPQRPNQKGSVANNGTLQSNAVGGVKGPRGGLPSASNNNSSSKSPRKKEAAAARSGDFKPDNAEENDIFAKASSATNLPGDLARRGGRRGGLRGARGSGLPRGAARGGGAGGGGPASGGRGTRTFMNRGLNQNNNNNNDGFPNSIETWTNSTAEQAKNSGDDLNTMTVGNWSDIAGNEDWSEEDWTSQPMETKVFTPSSKTIMEKDENVAEQPKPVNQQSGNSAPQASPQLSFISANKSETDSAQPQQPTMSAILSGSIKRSSPATAGQALLQQIQQQQQQSSAPQNSNLNQYNLSQYSKQATESIKSLVGLSSNISNELISSSNDHSLDGNLASQVGVNKQQQQQPNANQHQQQQSRLKVQNQRASKIPESAVEMPSNDPISNLSVHFGSLEFGTNFSIGANDSNLFDSVTPNANSKQQEANKNLNMLASNDSSANANANYRTSSNASQQQQQQTNKSMLQTSVFSQSLNESNLNSDHRNDKQQQQQQQQLNSNNYSANKQSQQQQQLDRKNDYMNMNAMASYKQSYTNDNVYSSSTAYPASNVGGYYSSSNQATPFVNAGIPAGAQSLMGNVYGSNAYNSASVNSVGGQSISKNRDMDNSITQQQQQVTASSASAASKPYDATSSVGNSMSLMSNSTATTNVLKNTLSASKGVHSVPPGVQQQQQQQPAQVLSAPYIMGNTAGMPIPYPYPYDVQFQTPRDHGYPSYAAADVKYNRGNESDMLPVSSQAAGAVQTATQAHNQPYMNTYPPGYGFYFAGVNFAHQGIYSAAQHPALYPVQAQTTASAGSAFAKANTAANYGSHSYNSGYDSLGAVAQTQDYVNKSYPQQLQQHKQMSGANSGDLAGGSQQSMYGKNHSQMNKSYDKQGFQQAAQFNLSNSAQNANLSSAYGPPYLLPQQSMHHSMASTEQTQQPPGVGNQRSLTQNHKGPSSNNPSYGKFSWN